MMRKRARGQLRRIAKVLAALFLMAVLLLAAVHVWGILRLRRELASIRAAGCPATVEELNAVRKLPAPEETGATLVRMAAPHIEVEPEEVRSCLLGRSSPLADPMSAMGYRFRQKSRRLLYPTAELPSCVPPVPYPQLMQRVTYFDDARKALLLLALDVASPDDDAQPAKAIDCIVALTSGLFDYRYRKGMETGIFGIEMLALSLESRFARMVEDNFWYSETAGDTPELTSWQLQQLEGRLQRFDDPALLRDVLMAERCYVRSWSEDLTWRILSGGMWIVENPAGYRIIGPEEAVCTAAWWRLRGCARTDQLEALRMYGTLIRLTEIPPWEAGRADRALSLKISALPNHCVVTRYLHESARQLRMQFADMRARVRCMQVGLAAMRFRKDEQRLPEALEELVPQYMRRLPLDPYTGEPLKMKPLRRDMQRRPWVVYSVDGNHRDDGGQDGYDVTFTIDPQRVSPYRSD